MDGQSRPFSFQFLCVRRVYRQKSFEALHRDHRKFEAHDDKVVVEKVQRKGLVLWCEGRRGGRGGKHGLTENVIF